MPCPGRGICSTLETLLGHYDMHLGKRDGRYSARISNGVDEAWDGIGDTLYDAVEMAVDRFALEKTHRVSRGPVGSGDL